jgi:hypothetical protein
MSRRCVHCGRSGARSDRRHLCAGCYSQGPVRSCFTTNGEKIADAPERTEAPEPSIDELEVLARPRGARHLGPRATRAAG